MIRVVRSSSTTAADGDDAAGDRGRRVVCASPRGASPSTVLLRVAPFAALLNPSLWSTHCHTCFHPSTTLSRCGRCRVVYYCSRTCQQRDWKPDHAVECRPLAQLATLRLRCEQLSDVLLLGRVVRRLASSGPADDVSPLQLAWDETDCTQETQLLVVLAQKLGLVTGVSTATSVAHLQRLLSRFRHNNFSICDARLLPVGAGCFPLAAMVNHSCDPNAVITFEPSTHTVVFRALRPIRADEEITHAYDDTALPRLERQRQLRLRYHFTCTCPRCFVSLDDSEAKDRFLDADIDGVEQVEWTPTRRQQVDESVAMLSECDKSTSRETTLQLLTKALAIQNAALHHDNIQRLSTLSRLFTLQLHEPSKDTLMDAIRTGEQILGVYDRAYAATHPMVGLHLFTMGDLCAALDRRDDAKRYFTAALDILRVTHGGTHTFVTMSQQRLAEL